MDPVYGLVCRRSVARVSGDHYCFGYNPHHKFAPLALNNLQRLGGLLFNDVEQLPAVSGELETWE